MLSNLLSISIKYDPHLFLTQHVLSIELNELFMKEKRMISLQ